MTTPDKLSPDHQTELKALEAMPDEAIDTTDIPEVTDWTGARRGALYRPVKRQVTIRLDADIIAWFQAGGAQGYQSRINAALREYIAQHEK